MVTGISYTSDKDLFGNTDMATIDEDASLDVLAGMWYDAIKTAYPDADVEIDWANASPTNRLRVYTDTQGYQEEGKAEDDVRDIVGHTWELWFDRLVYLPATA